MVEALAISTQFIIKTYVKITALLINIKVVNGLVKSMVIVK